MSHFYLLPHKILLIFPPNFWPEKFSERTPYWPRHCYVFLFKILVLVLVIPLCRGDPLHVVLLQLPWRLDHTSHLHKNQEGNSALIEGKKTISIFGDCLDYSWLYIHIARKWWFIRELSILSDIRYGLFCNVPTSKVCLFSSSCFRVS